METRKYKVRFFIDNTYEVLEKVYDYDDEYWESVFQGSISDCEAYIRLHEKGYFD
jgi:hypothetical protein